MSTSSAIRNPLLREHFVYRAYDADGELLYVGCTARLDERTAAHRSQSDWFHLAVRFTLQGPYNYDTARQGERDALRDERPLYAFHPTRRTVLAAGRRIEARRTHFLIAQGHDPLVAALAAVKYADTVLPIPSNRSPFKVTDLTVAAAIWADHLDADSYTAREATA